MEDNKEPSSGSNPAEGKTTAEPSESSPSNPPNAKWKNTLLLCWKLRGGKKEKANSRPWERRAGPTRLTCGVRERNTDPKSLQGFLSLILFLSLHLFQLHTYSVFALVSFLLSSISVFPQSPQPRLMSAAMGYSRFIALSFSFFLIAVRLLFAVRTERSPERAGIIGRSQRFTVTPHCSCKTFALFPN